jgi:hypothetical protein
VTSLWREDFLGKEEAFSRIPRSALLAKNTMHMSSKQFKKEYQEAQDYETLLEEALEAKEGKGFKFLSLGIYLTYLTYNVLSLSFLNTFLTPPKVM